MVDSAPPHGASPLRGRCWRRAGGCRLCVSVDGAERLTARLWRAPATAVRFAPAPRGRGAARPYPRTPTRGKLSLQAFARCARVLRFAQVFLCSRTQPPVRVRAAGALSPRLFASLQPPGGRGATRPDPRTPTRGKLSLQAFARCARVLRFAQVFLCWRTLRPAVFVLAHAATRPLALTPLVRTTLVCFSAAACLAPRIAARLPH